MRGAEGERGRVGKRGGERGGGERGGEMGGGGFISNISHPLL